MGRDRTQARVPTQQHPGFQGGIPVLEHRGQTVHHSQPQRLKPNCILLLGMFKDRRSVSTITASLRVSYCALMFPLSSLHLSRLRLRFHRGFTKKQQVFFLHSIWRLLCTEGATLAHGDTKTTACTRLHVVQRGDFFARHAFQ